MKLIEDLYRGEIVELEFVVKTELDGLETELHVMSQHDANGIRMLRVHENGSSELLYKEEDGYTIVEELDSETMEEIENIALDLL